MPKDRLEVWLALWGQSLPTAARGRPPTSADWQCAVERFIAALKADLDAAPVSWLGRIRLLHGLQKTLAAQGVPGEALRPLVLAIILRVYFA